jgi:hypothetical protein
MTVQLERNDAYLTLRAAGRHADAPSVP